MPFSLLRTHTAWRGVGGGRRRRESETEREFEFVFGRWGGGEARVIMAQATTYGTCVRRWPDGVLVERTNSWPGFGGGGGGGGGGEGGSGPTLGFARRGEGRNSCRKDELSECVLCTVYLVKGRDMKEQRKKYNPNSVGILSSRYCASA